MGWGREAESPCPALGGNNKLVGVVRRNVTVSQQVTRSVCWRCTEVSVIVCICIRRKSFLQKALPELQCVYKWVKPSWDSSGFEEDKSCALRPCEDPSGGKTEGWHGGRKTDGDFVSGISVLPRGRPFVMLGFKWDSCVLPFYLPLEICIRASLSISSHWSEKMLV